MGHPCKIEEGDTVVIAALKVLQEPDPLVKAELTFAAHRLWNQGKLRVPSAEDEPVSVPSRPARADDKVRLLHPRDMPKLGKGGTLASRQAIVHSLAHIENWAIDLSWDIIARFGSCGDYNLPREFYDDFVQVAEDECRHFSLLNKRLEEMGSHYGALPAHDGLWESASRTCDSLAARLAVEHCVHEARGLDVLPSTIHKFRSSKDEATAQLLEGIIYKEEITHCAAGVRWLKWLHEEARSHVQNGASPSPEATPSSSPTCGPPCNPPTPANGAPARPWMHEAVQYSSVQLWFHSLIQRNFSGVLKPPFNTEARLAAGFDESWYLPLAAEPTAAVTTEATHT